jgi:hypothetical protein
MLGGPPQDSAPVRVESDLTNQPQTSGALVQHWFAQSRILRTGIVLSMARQRS